MVYKFGFLKIHHHFDNQRLSHELDLVNIDSGPRMVESATWKSCPVLHLSVVIISALILCTSITFFSIKDWKPLLRVLWLCDKQLLGIWCHCFQIIPTF
jgi:hypothetical protein